MKLDWTPLRNELKIWHAQGLLLPFWWRDDDATTPTAQLEKLHEQAETAELPVHLAIIPRDAVAELAAYVARHPLIVPAVHGWAHENHARPPAKKSEFGADRPLALAEADLRNGLDRMQALFGDRCAPMFVPPWNRIDDALMPVLAGLGYRAVSTYLPRQTADAAPGLRRINTHIDPIHWRGSRGLIDPEILIAQTVQLLVDRRTGRADNAEPLGYLTHHLVHDGDIWAFTKQFLSEMRDGPLQPWRLEKGEPQ